MQQTGLLRNTIDKYYTKPEIAQQCIDEVVDNYHLENFDVVIEPSAGNGSFSNLLNKMNLNCLAYDIKPEHPTIIKQNFLKLKKPKGSVIIIGNPPFGRQSVMAKLFIKHACNIASVVAFILPKSFKKRSFQKAFPLDWHLEKSIDLPDNSFTIDECEHDVPCVFQIWEKRDELREVHTYAKPEWLEYTNAENANFAIRRVGVNAGLASVDTSLSKQSHYFIKVLDDRNITALVSAINHLSWEFNNSVGPKSISKDELHEKLLFME